MPDHPCADTYILMGDVSSSGGQGYDYDQVMAEHEHNRDSHCAWTPDATFPTPGAQVTSSAEYDSEASWQDNWLQAWVSSTWSESLPFDNESDRRIPDTENILASIPMTLTPLGQSLAVYEQSSSVGVDSRMHTVHALEYQQEDRTVETYAGYGNFRSTPSPLHTLGRRQVGGPQRRETTSQRYAPYPICIQMLPQGHTIGLQVTLPTGTSMPLHTPSTGTGPNDWRGVGDAPRADSRDLRPSGEPLSIPDYTSTLLNAHTAAATTPPTVPYGITLLPQERYLGGVHANRLTEYYINFNGCNIGAAAEGRIENLLDEDKNAFEGCGEQKPGDKISIRMHFVNPDGTSWPEYKANQFRPGPNRRELLKKVAKEVAKYVTLNKCYYEGVQVIPNELSLLWLKRVGKGSWQPGIGIVDR